MKVEASHRHPDQQALRKGDFVDVRLNADLNSGFYGFVVLAGPERLRLKAHEAVGNIKTDYHRACLDIDLVIPMTSVAWIRHLPTKPVDCKCKEGLS